VAENQNGFYYLAAPLTSIPMPSKLAQCDRR